MKKSTPYLLSGLVAIILGFSMAGCQKEYDPGVPDVPVVDDSTGTVTGDSIYLDKLFDLYDDGSGIDTQTVLIVKYDSRKRVSEMHDSLRLHPGIEPIRDIYFSYNGNDTVPSKTIFIDTENGTTNYFTDTTYHFYDASGRKIRDSILSGSVYPGGSTYNLSVKRYTYDTNALYGETRYDNFAGNTGFLRDTAILDARGNILSSKKYSIDPTTSVATVASTSLFTYDTHPHPFSKLSCFWYFYNFPIGETLYTEYAGYNNALSQNEVSAGGQTYNLTSTFIYNALGLPVIMNSTYSDGDIDKVIFKYKSL